MHAGPADLAAGATYAGAGASAFSGLTLWAQAPTPDAVLIAKAGVVGGILFALTGLGAQVLLPFYRTYSDNRRADKDRAAADRHKQAQIDAQNILIGDNRATIDALQQWAAGVYRAHPAGALPPPPAPRRPKVLVVEDDAVAADQLVKILGRLGWGVERAGTAELAEEKLNDYPDAALLDLTLAGGSGVDVLRAIRASGRPMRVIVMTGAAEGTPELVAARALAPDAILRKPLDLAGLLTLLGDLTPREAIGA